MNPLLYSIVCVRLWCNALLWCFSETLVWWWSCILTWVLFSYTTHSWTTKEWVNNLQSKRNQSAFYAFVYEEPSTCFPRLNIPALLDLRSDSRSRYKTHTHTVLLDFIETLQPVTGQSHDVNIPLSQVGENQFQNQIHKAKNPILDINRNLYGHGVDFVCRFLAKLLKTSALVHSRKLSRKQRTEKQNRHTL